jgi:hypothetical protein
VLSKRSFGVLYDESVLLLVEVTLVSTNASSGNGGFISTGYGSSGQKNHGHFFRE